MKEPDETGTPQRRPIRSFVMRAGRLTSGQSRAIAELWPRVGVDFAPATLLLDEVFGRNAPRTLDPLSSAGAPGNSS